MKYAKPLLSSLGAFLLGSSSWAANTPASSAAESVLLRDSTVSYIPFYASRILLTDSLSRGLSPQALSILSRPFTPLPTGISAEEAGIYSPLFVPLLFDIEDIRHDFPSEKTADMLALKDNPFRVGPTLTDFAYRTYVDSLAHSGRLQRYRQQQALVSDIRQKTLLSSMDAIRVTSSMLPERIVYRNIEASAEDFELNIGDPKVESVNPDELEKKIIERVYWTKSLESTLQFAQNQLSENWYKGGNNSLNLNMRTYANVAYNKGRVRWVNELESKLGFFKSPNDPISKYRISDDLFRFVSNFGVKAFDHWYYTLDGQFRTQMLINRDKEGGVVSRPFAPFLIDGGPGMKYEIKKTFDDPFKKLSFSGNISPISVTFLYTYSDDINKGRVGLQPDKRHKLRLGSTIRTMLDFTLSQTTSWQSRIFYNTSFKSVETEFENTVSFALTRFFSVRFNLNLRFDDSIILEDKTFKDMLQYNELLSIGFSYKL